MAAAGVNRQHINVGHAVAWHQGNEPPFPQILPNQKSRLPDDALPGDRRFTGRVAFVGVHLVIDLDHMRAALLIHKIPLIGSGRIFAFPGVAAYAASKSGLIRLTQALAAEYGPQGIRVNAILPGAVDTEMYRAMNNTPESQSFVTNLHALKRPARPEELARSVLYLASDDSSFVTGTASLVDGGASITRT